ncbi:HNH endonuclease [Metabacillus indicus]|uniref:HNH endonuclease n=1 Tax=Metabacillus indicus TaxID=246786 RepID=UPI00319E15ED
MEIQEAFELYQERIDKTNTTWGQDRHKINRFIEIVGKKTDSKEAINESNLVGFYSTLDRNQNGYFFTLKKFYNFIQEEVLSLPVSERKVFPLEAPKDKNIEGNNKKPKANYLPEGFNFYDLFSDDFYIHLCNENASVTIKACIAIGLGASYNTSDITDMTINDIQVNSSDSVRVKNIYEHERVQWITLTGKLAKYVIDYYNLRLKSLLMSVDTNQLFFQKFWKGRELEFDPYIATEKPPTIKSLMTYMLRYISFKVDIDPHLYPTHLYINSVLHQLIQTNGMALEAIIRTFGWERLFVKEVFYHFIQNREQKEFLGFNPFDSESLIEVGEDKDLESENPGIFFPESSSDDLPETDEEIIIIEMLTGRRKRDTKKVKALKTLYANCCQICGVALVDINGIGYSEVNHIQPLSQHNGIDKEVNMIVLCPNHHTLMDMGIITIDPVDKETILHVDESNPLHLVKLCVVKHPFSESCVKYHHDVIFNTTREKIKDVLQKKINR